MYVIQRCFYDVMCFHKKTLQYCNSSLLHLNLVILVNILKPCSVPHHFQAVLSLVDPLSITCLHCVVQFILHQTRHSTTLLNSLKVLLLISEALLCDVVVLCRVASIICPTWLSYHRVVKKSRSHCKKFWAYGIL